MPPNVNSLSQLLSDVATIRAQLTALEGRVVTLDAAVATTAKNAEIERLNGIVTTLRADLDSVREAASGLGVRVTAMETRKAKGK